MNRPKRSEYKYWTGTRNFNHIQYETDLEDYIDELEEQEALRQPLVSGQLVCPDCANGRDEFEPDWECPECRRKNEAN